MAVSILFSLFITAAAYFVSQKLQKRYPSPLLNVVVVSSALVISALLLLHIPYTVYQPGKDLITAVLGPATVALAVPLYKNRMVVKKYLGSILACVLVSSSLTAAVAMAIAHFAALPQDVVVSIGAKSVTAPIAAEIARVNGGDPGLTIAFVIANGTLGAIFGPFVLNFLRVKNPVIRGLALGTTSHGQGTATALMEGEQQGLMAGIGMALSAVVTSTLIPFIVPLILRF